MIVNGKEVVRIYKSTANIQTKMDETSDLTNSAKRETTDKENKRLNTIAIASVNNTNINSFGAGIGVVNDCNIPLLSGKKALKSRKEYYRIYKDMGTNVYINRGLQIIADSASLKNDEGNVIKNYSADDDEKEILDSLFFERININKHLWSIAKETAQFGEDFFEIIPDSYTNPTEIVRIRRLDRERVNRIEINGKLAFYTYIEEVEKNKTDLEMMSDLTSLMSGQESQKEVTQVLVKLEPWQIVHFKIENPLTAPYGGSLLESGIQPYERLQMLENGIIVYRLARIPERRVFKIDLGNIRDRNEARNLLNQIMNDYRTNQVIDESGNLNRNASALSLTQDIFIPVGAGNSTDVTTLPGGTALQSIDDIRYFRDQILWTMNIPQEVLGSTSDNAAGSGARGSLALKDLRFGKYIEKLQYCIQEGLVKIASVELFFKHKKKEDLKNFKIEMTSPSDVEEVMNLEKLNQRIQSISSIIQTNLFSKKFILKKILKLTDKEINDILFDKKIEDMQGAGGNQTMGGGADMSSMGGGADMSSTGATTQEAPQPSVLTTENFSDKMMNVFGKNILIENKEDIAKIIVALEEYEEEKASSTKIIEEEVIDTDSLFTEELRQVLSLKKSSSNIKSTNAINLIYENELGGLDFSENAIKIFSKPNKLGILSEGKYEEKEIKIGKRKYNKKNNE